MKRAIMKTRATVVKINHATLPRGIGGVNPTSSHHFCSGELPVAITVCPNCHTPLNIMGGCDKCLAEIFANEISNHTTPKKHGNFLSVKSGDFTWCPYRGWV